MANITNAADREHFREMLKTSDEADMTGQKLVHSGALHALKTLRALGFTHDNLEDMIDSLEEGLRDIREAAEARGIELPEVETNEL